MKIALDFDDTFTKDPTFWLDFIDKAELRNHEVIIVTFRDPSLPIHLKVPIPVFYTSYTAKRQYMENKGIDIDVWIDDSPETILRGSEWTPEERERWRNEHFIDVVAKTRLA